VGEQEAAQLLFATGFACSGIYYLVMFAIVALGKGAGESRTPFWLKVAVCAAAAVTVLGTGFEIVPVLDVPHPWQFGLKVGGATVAINALGWWLYRRATPGQRAYRPPA
jgi:hypothetical protein